MEGQVNPEVFLISAVIQTSDMATPGDAGIEAEFFHSHRSEWEWIERFKTRFGKCPDKATFRAQFPDFPLLKTTDTDHGCDLVHKSHLKYVVTETVNKSAKYLLADRPEDALNHFRSQVTGLDENPRAKANVNVIRDSSEVFQEAARRVEAVRAGGLAGISTGFPTLNDRTGGLQPGHLWIMAARLGVGKTWGLVKMAKSALMDGKKVAFVSLEQPKSEIVFRIHTMLAREFGYSLRHSSLMYGTNLDLRDYKGFLTELPERCPGELMVADPTRGRVSPYTLATIIEAVQPDCLFLDYITLMKKDSDEWQGVAKLSAETKEVALSYGLPIVCAAQINRLGEGGRKPPSVSQLSQSDSIGQDADVVVTSRKFTNQARQHLLAKNRQGLDDVVFYSSFDPDHGVIDEITYEQAVRLAAEDAVDDD